MPSITDASLQPYVPISHTIKVFRFLMRFKIKTALRLINAYELTLAEMLKVMMDRIHMGKGFYQKLQDRSMK